MPYIPPWAFQQPEINTFDIDGVIYFGEGVPGVFPSSNDVLITGRSFEEKDETMKMLESRGIRNRVIFSKIPLALKTREISGYHKALTLLELRKDFKVNIHFEDDPVQKAIIEAMCPDVNVVHLVHELTKK